MVVALSKRTVDEVPQGWQAATIGRVVQDEGV